MDEDFILIRKIKGGNEEAMDSFVRKYYATILRYCNYHAPDRYIAEDLTQETFVRFFKSISNYRHRGKASAYLCEIAKNVCIDHSKKSCEIPGLEFSEFADEKYLTSIESKIVINQSLYELPDQLREVLLLHYFQGFTLKEVAAILGIGIPLAKYRISRAREQLKKILRKEDFI